MIVLAVVLFAAGVALLMMSSDFLALYRSRLAKHHQNRAGTKGVITVVAGGILLLAGILLLVLRAAGLA